MPKTNADAAATTKLNQSYVKVYLKGIAYVFQKKDGAPAPLVASIVTALKPEAASFLKFGHVGWAFGLPDGTLFYGSKENETGSFYVGPGTPNECGYWKEKGTYNEMIKAFSDRQYDHYRCRVVDTPESEAAFAAALKSSLSGFNGLINNCLHDVINVLRAYGANPPPGEVRCGPNFWFEDGLSGWGEIHEIGSQDPSDKTDDWNEILSSLAWQPSEKCRPGDIQLFEVSMDKLDSLWSKVEMSYIPRGSRDDKTAKTEAYLLSKQGAVSFRTAVVAYQKGEAWVEDGRHRMSVIRDHGIGRAKVTLRCDPSEVDAAKSSLA